jgi:hypothetical protein
VSKFDQSQPADLAGRSPQPSADAKLPASIPTPVPLERAPPSEGRPGTLEILADLFKGATREWPLTLRSAFILGMLTLCICSVAFVLQRRAEMWSLVAIIALITYVRAMKVGNSRIRRDKASPPTGQGEDRDADV